MPQPTVKRRQRKAGAGMEPPTEPPRASSDSGASATPPSGDINSAVVKLLDALTAFVKEVTMAFREDR